MTAGIEKINNGYDIPLLSKYFTLNTFRPFPLPLKIAKQSRNFFQIRISQQKKLPLSDGKYPDIESRQMKDIEKWVALNPQGVRGLR